MLKRVWTSCLMCFFASEYRQSSSCVWLLLTINNVLLIVNSLLTVNKVFNVYVTRDHSTVRSRGIIQKWRVNSSLLYVNVRLLCCFHMFGLLLVTLLFYWRVEIQFKWHITPQIGTLALIFWHPYWFCTFLVCMCEGFPVSPVVNKKEEWCFRLESKEVPWSVLTRCPKVQRSTKTPIVNYFKNFWYLGWMINICLCIRHTYF